MDDGDSHPASDNFNQIDSVEKHKSITCCCGPGEARRQAMLFCAFLESFIPETSGQALQAEREERISNT